MTTHNLPADAARIAEQLDLAPLPHEGGLFRQVYQDEHSTAIYYMLAGDEFSSLHLLDAVEVYHHYAGDPLHLLLLFPDGTISEPVLGTDLDAGQQPVIVAPAGVWQGSSSAGAWTLMGTTMAPGFTWDAFSMGDRADLQKRYPAATDRITELTDEPAPTSPDEFRNGEQA